MWSGVVLCAAAACGGVLHPPPVQSVHAAACELVEAPSTTADTATIAFHARGVSRETCALALVADGLRPWPTPSSTHRWTVHVSLTATGATARRLGSEAARDVIDAGQAFLATEDDELIVYAAARDLDVTPLPWSRAYLALSADSSMTLGASIDADAVRADARLAAPLACDAIPGERLPEATQTRSGRVLYHVGDRTARELAERLVALTGRADATAVGVRADELNAELRAGDALSYIISVRRESLCETLSTLAELVTWLSPHSIRALVDTRAHAIAPRPTRP